MPSDVTGSNDSRPNVPPRPKSALHFVTSEDNAKAKVAEEARKKAREVAREAEVQELYKALSYSDEILRKAAEWDAVTSRVQERVRLREEKSASEPPPPIDQTRFGHRILAKHGYDSSSGQGLGAKGQGITTPIELAQKNDKLGIGVKAKTTTLKTASAPQGITKKKTMGAKEARDHYEQERKRAAELQQLFYSNRHEEFFHELEKGQ